MTREEFINILEKKGYPFEDKGDRLFVGREFDCLDIDLSRVRSIPPSVIFRNGGSVNLNSIEEIPSGVEFRNLMRVSLHSLRRRIDPSVRFRSSLIVVSPLLGCDSFIVEGGEDGEIVSYMNSFTSFSLGVCGIDDKKVLNHMIELGLFMGR
jgi:hypothetical protein